MDFELKTLTPARICAEKCDALIVLVPTGVKPQGDALSDLMAACRDYHVRTGRRILFGWTLIDGRNDTPVHARQVADLLAGLDAHLNLIRLNPTAGFEGRTGGGEAANLFQTIVQDAGIPCTIRQFRGVDVAAGCGQLKASRPRRTILPA